MFLSPLDESSVVRAVDELAAEGVEAIAVSYLFSFLNPAHERRTREIIAERHPEIMVSLSSEVDPAFREYERTCVTAFDAYIKPVVGRYLESMEQDLAGDGVRTPLQIMQSRGGISSSAVARQRPVRLFLSGPAAGVVGGLEVGRAAGIEDLITVDIGGTSCDIALISRGQPLIRAEGEIGGYSVRVPMVDVNAIGSGGGSIAWIDGAGSLRVGPQSAGSEPGPACYGRGGERATVTDASVVLGYINPDYFAAGSLKLSPDLARQTIETTIARSARRQRRACSARHPSRPQRPDGGSDPAGLDRPRHRSARLHAAAAGRRRAAACDARWRANWASGASPCRRIPACCRRPACSSRRSSTRVPWPSRGCSRASTGRRWNGRSAEPRPGLRQR